MARRSRRSPGSEPRLDALTLSRDRGVEDAVDALHQERRLAVALSSGQSAATPRLAPLAQGGLEHARQGVSGPLARRGRDIFQRAARADLILEPLALRLMALRRNDLSMMTAHDHSDAKASTIITPRTTQSACRKRCTTSKLAGDTASVGSMMSVSAFRGRPRLAWSGGESVARRTLRARRRTARSARPPRPAVSVPGARRPWRKPAGPLASSG